MDLVPVARSECGLPEHGIVFCSFNTDYKIEPHLFEVWMRVLRAVPHSVLWLLVRTPEARENLRAAAGFHGVDPNRLIFAAPLSKEKHLARLNLADLALDTLTVNGHTTTADALAVGVPVVTCLGSHFASRVAGSLLKNIGLDEFVAQNLDEYQRLAIQLGTHGDRLAAVKAKLKSNRKIYPLFDCDRYVRNLEAAFRLMWKNFISGGPPRSFSVPQA
jgi:protein O-GlcNAc transferase